MNRFVGNLLSYHFSKRGEEEKKKREHIALPIVTSAAASSLISLPIVAPFLSFFKDDISERERKKIFKKFAPKGVELVDPKYFNPLAIGDIGRNLSSAYIDRLKTVAAGNNRSILLHEIGHAQNFSGKIKNNPAKFLSLLYPLSMVANSIAKYRAAYNGTQREEDETKKWLATGALLTAPVLLEEGRATTKAIKMTRELDKSGFIDAIKKNKALAPAYATYLALAASPAIAYAVSKKTHEILNKRKLKEQ